MAAEAGLDVMHDERSVTSTTTTSLVWLTVVLERKGEEGKEAAQGFWGKLKCIHWIKILSPPTTTFALNQSPLMWLKLFQGTVDSDWIPTLPLLLLHQSVLPFSQYPLWILLYPSIGFCVSLLDIISKPHSSVFIVMLKIWGEGRVVCFVYTVRWHMVDLLGTAWYTTWAFCKFVCSKSLN